MATALLFSAIAIGLSELGYPILHEESRELLRRIDFSSVLMTWVLPALLFAGALHVDLRDLHSYKELQRLSRVNRVPYCYETTVGEAIPLLGPLRYR